MLCGLLIECSVNFVLASCMFLDCDRMCCSTTERKTNAELTELLGLEPVKHILVIKKGTLR